MDSEVDSVYRYTSLPNFDELFLTHLIAKNPLLVTALPFTVHYIFRVGWERDEIQIKPLRYPKIARRLNEFPQEYMNTGLMNHRFLVVTVQVKYEKGGHSMAILMDNKNRRIYFIDPTNSREDLDRIVDGEQATLVEEANNLLHLVLKKLFQDKGFFLNDKQAAYENGTPLYTIVSLVHVLYECNMFVEGSREAVNQKFRKHVSDVRYCLVLTHAVIFAITTYVPVIEGLKEKPKWKWDQGQNLCIHHFIKHFICHPRFDTAKAVEDEAYMKFLHGHTNAVQILPAVCKDFATSVIGTSFLESTKETLTDLARFKSQLLRERLVKGNHRHYCSRQEFFDKLRMDFDANCLLSTNPWKMLMEFPREVIGNFAVERYGKNTLGETINTLGHRPFELFKELGLIVDINDITTREGWLARNAIDFLVEKARTQTRPDNEEDEITRYEIIAELKRMERLWINYNARRVRNDLAKEIAKQS
jgi:hypothetical protein